LSPSELRVLVFAKQAAAAGVPEATLVYAICMTSVNGISTNACTAGALVSRPMSSPPVGRSVMQLMTGHGNAALQGQQTSR